MAAIVRGARAGRGGPGRAQGRQRGAAAQQVPAPAAAPVPAQALGPLNQQWKVWREGNLNAPDNANKKSDQLTIFQFLEKSPLVDEMELVTFGIPDGFPPQPADITRKLVGLVDSYNTMMPLRQKYLYKKIRGERGKEMADLEKTLTRCVNRIDEKIEGIREAGGFCPNRPKLFDSVPKPLKQQKEKVKSGVK